MYQILSDTYTYIYYLYTYIYNIYIYISTNRVYLDPTLLFSDCDDIGYYRDNIKLESTRVY